MMRALAHLAAVLLGAAGLLGLFAVGSAWLGPELFATVGVLLCSGIAVLSVLATLITLKKQHRK